MPVVVPVLEPKENPGVVPAGLNEELNKLALLAADPNPVAVLKALVAGAPNAVVAPKPVEVAGLFAPKRLVPVAACENDVVPPNPDVAGKLNVGLF